MTRRMLAWWLPRLSLAAAVLALTATLAAVGFAPFAEAQAVRPPEGAVTNAAPAAPEAGLQDPVAPLGLRGPSSDSDLWRAIRGGDEFGTQTLAAGAGVLVQSEGSTWQRFRDGPLAEFGLWAIGGMLALLALFLLLRGRIRIEHGRSGLTILRFTTLERFGHWLLAGSFILLAITGLTLLYGRTALIPVVGKEAYASYAWFGKHLHNLVGFAFMAGLALTFLTWVRHNLPTLGDLRWLAKGGGLFSKGAHVPAKKFNAGQKLIFWATMLLGFSLSLSGWALLFPFDHQYFAPTFAILNGLGLGLPETLTPMQEMQLAQLWHGAVALAMTAVIIAHIYLGSIGMEGAFDAMGTGRVDYNWAREHHELWVEEMEVKEARGRPTAMRAGPDPAATPAE